MADKILLKIRVTLRRDGFFEGHGFGRGIVLLLEGIERNGSLYSTTNELGMAYSKAWRILHMTEKEFGINLVNRDGARGSTLTEEGHQFLAHFKEIEDAAYNAAKNVFDKYFNNDIA